MMRSTSVPKSLTLGLAGAITLVLAGTLASPSTSAQPAASQGPDEAVCMVRATPDGRPMPIILPAVSESAMQAQGFVVAPCQEVFPGVASRRAYRNQVCRMASLWREELQRRFEEARGVRPAVLCGMAEQVIGQWDRRGRSQ